MRVNAVDCSGNGKRQSLEEISILSNKIKANSRVKLSKAYLEEQVRKALNKAV